MVTPQNPKGLMDTSLLVKKEGQIDNKREFTIWTEYYYQERLVHRSADVHLKEIKPLRTRTFNFIKDIFT
jgi:hypothetical protein